MARYYSISGSDSIDSIAYDNGLFWETLWNHPNNAELRKVRGEQRNILEEGDRLFVPDITARDTPKAVDQRHRFRRKGIPAPVEVRLTWHGDEPRADLGYRITTGKHQIEGKTDAEGWIRFALMPNVSTGTLTLESGEMFTLTFSALGPKASLKGVQGRLRNLRHFDGPLDGQPSAALETALRNFQALYGLEETGQADEATVAELEKRHGS